MSKWLEDLLLNIEIWLYRRLRKLLQHGGEDFAVSLDTLHAHLADKESKVAAVYNDLEERLVNVEEGVPVRPLPAVQDLEHLQEAVELLGERKIEWRGSTAVKDGTSFVRLAFDSATREDVTEIDDTNFGWTMDAQFSLFPNVRKLTLGCKVFDWVGHQKPVITGLANLEELYLPYLEHDQAGNPSESQRERNTIQNCPNLKAVYADNLKTRYCGFHEMSFIQHCDALTHFYARSFESHSGDYRDALISICANLTNVYLTEPTFNSSSGNNRGTFGDCPKLIHIEVGCYHECNKSLNVKFWSPTNALRTDTTASDYIDLREDKDEQGEFINATNLEQFLANFRKYIILRLASRKSTTALTLTLSASVYQNIYGLDSSNNTDNNSWARTHTLADLGLTADDLTEAEQAAGITINTIYATWLDTYRAAINWNIGH